MRAHTHIHTRTHLFPQATAIRRLLKAPLDESKSRHDVSKIKQYLKSEWKKILAGKVSSAFAGMQAANVTCRVGEHDV